MNWILNFFNGVVSVFNSLVDFMTTDIEVLGGSPLVLLSTGLIAFLGAMLILRIVRG